MNNKIISYIVNLKKDEQRKRYMENLMNSYDFLELEFVEAVYGKELSEEELAICFNQDLAYKRYGRMLNRGEIGCTLSHYKCYQKLLESNNDYVLILEDDITILKDIRLLPNIVSKLETKEPLVLFLSGDYWYKSLENISEDYKIANVYDAVGTYAYFINKSAARLILNKNKIASHLADNWSLFRRQGLKMKAVFPYLIDANIEDFESSINQVCFGEKRKNMVIKMRVIAYWNAFIKKILLKQGQFVSKIRK